MSWLGVFAILLLISGTDACSSAMTGADCEALHCHCTPKYGKVYKCCGDAVCVPQPGYSYSKCKRPSGDNNQEDASVVSHLAGVVSDYLNEKW